MRSKTRIDCDNAVAFYTKEIKKNPPEKKNMLYVGIAGDPPGGEYTPLFRGDFQVKTFDVNASFRPDIVGDITQTAFEDGEWGVVVCVQVLEHVKSIWTAPKEINRILCRGGYAIVDTPWLYPYHAEPGFGDYWRISKDGMRELFSPYFDILHVTSTDNLTSCLVRKP
jgi:hypothetical protein